jgi:hypothetical protein
MAQMPRGEPRSVPDLDGDGYDGMLLQEKLKKAIAETNFDRGLDSFSPNYLAPPPQFAQTPDTPMPQDALFCPVPNAVSPAELANQQRAVERALLMASSPLAGAAYGLATVAGASQQGRDQALAAGEAADTVMMGVAPFGAAMRGRPTPPSAATGPVGSQRPAIRYGDLNSNGQATGVSATLTTPVLGAGTRANWRQTPPGWRGNGRLYNEGRAHLVGRQLGGLGIPPNIVAMTQNGANAPQMSGFEREVAQRVRAGEVIDYSAIPFYDDGVLPPSGVLVTATGSRQPPTAQLIPNPAGRPR